jgi:hypothetical protein
VAKRDRVPILFKRITRWSAEYDINHTDQAEEVVDGATLEGAIQAAKDKLADNEGCEKTYYIYKLAAKVSNKRTEPAPTTVEVFE